MTSVAIDPSSSPSQNVCPFRLWCCGSLRTATISVGFTNIISLILLTSYYLGTSMYAESFSLTMLVIAIIVMLLAFMNVGLIYGSTKRSQFFFVPWLIIYLPAILVLLIFVAVQFSVLEGKQLAAILLVIVSSYFYAIVVASYIELDLANKLLKESEDKEETDGSRLAKGNSSKKSREDCLIDLTELENLNSTTVDEKPPVDETFSALALRTPSTSVGENGRPFDKSGATAFCILDDSGEFTMPHDENVSSSCDFNFSSHFASGNGNGAHLLPVPEEVIPIKKLVEKIDSKKGRTESNELPKNGIEISLELPSKEESIISETESSLPLLTQTEGVESDQMPKTKMARNSKSLIDVDHDHRNGLLTTKSESKILSGRKFVNIDANFSPFRKSEQRNGPDDLPKMKIFLPKNSDSSDDDGSSSDEEEETDPLNLNAAAI